MAVTVVSDWFDAHSPQRSDGVKWGHMENGLHLDYGASLTDNSTQHGAHVDCQMLLYESQEFKKLPFKTMIKSFSMML